MKKQNKILLVLTILVALVMTFVGCASSDSKYFKRVSGYSFWNNKGSESIAQRQYYHIMKDFLSDGTIENGEVVKDGKVKKIAFIGWDGARAESLINILKDENDFETNSYADKAEFSGLNELKKTGGVYLAYCGGEKGKSSQQDTSTSASWTSEFTGVWGETHGVISNNHTKKIENKTIFLEYAERGLQTSLAFDWGDYFDIALKDEVKYLVSNKENNTINLTYKDIDRKIAENIDIAKSNENIAKSKNLKAENLELYNFVAMEKVSTKSPHDSAMRDYLLERIALGDDIVAGIFHNPDSSGHTDGFTNTNPSYVNAVRNSDEYLYQIMEVISEREKNNNEEWLILVANDHGGSDNGHGKQIYEHRTNWVASNKAIDNKYYGVKYDGYKENK